MARNIIERRDRSQFGRARAKFAGSDVGGGRSKGYVIGSVYRTDIKRTGGRRSETIELHPGLTEVWMTMISAAGL